MTCRIGNGAGFLGDNLDAPRLAGRAGRAGLPDARIPGRADALDPGPGAREEPSRRLRRRFSRRAQKPLRRRLRAQPGLKLVTNAGAMNPAELRRGRRPGCLWPPSWADDPIGVVTGDDLPADIAQAAGRWLPASRIWKPASRLDPGQACPSSAPTPTWGPSRSSTRSPAARGYVITGRVADASLYRRTRRCTSSAGPGTTGTALAAASVAGHVIECGAQVDRRLVSSLAIARPGPRRLSDRRVLGARRRRGDSRSRPTAAAR